MVISDKYKYLFIELPRTGTTAIYKELIDKYDGRRVLNRHATYEQFEKKATPEEKNYYKFSCIRHPMDRIVSLYVKLKNDQGNYYSNKIDQYKYFSNYKLKSRFKFIHKNNASFEDYFKRFYKVPYDDWSSLSHKNFDYIIKFENLDQGFSEVLKELGIEQQSELKKHNTTQNKDRNYWKYVESEEMKKLVVRKLGIFMEKWGYEFPDDWNDYKIRKWDRFLYSFFQFFRKIYWRKFAS